MNEPDNNETKDEFVPQGCREMLPALGFLALGLVLCPFATGILLPIFFGLERHDSAGMWGLAGVAHIAIGVLLSPVFIIGYFVSYSVYRRRARTRKESAARALGIGLIALVVASIVAWLFQGGGKIPTVQ